MTPKERKHHWYLKNRERIIAKTAAYQKADPQRWRMYKEKYREKNRERDLKRLRELNAKSRAARPWLHSMYTARDRAKRNGMPFALTRQWAESIWTGRCALTGIAFVRGKGCMCPFSPSLDRVRPELGYVPDNCRFVLQGVNALKGNGTDEDMLFIAESLIRSLTVDTKQRVA